MIAEYMMIMSDRGRLITPPWATRGGYLQNPSDKSMICFIPDVREFYVPDTVIEYTEAEVKSRSLTIHQTTPYINDDGSEMTDAEVEAMVQAIIDSNAF